MQTAEDTIRPGTTVHDEFGAWALARDCDNNWIAIQRATEILLLDAVDWRRFGLSMPQEA